MINKDVIRKWLEFWNKKNRKYIHFDVPINLENKINWQRPQDFFEHFLSAESVKRRAFWPFIHFVKKERKYKKNEKKVKDRHITKSREIYYASHLDSFIFSYYSFVLWEQYWEILKQYKLSENVLAYRKINWKNSINFAKIVFEDIVYFQNCFVYAFDISSFFDKLDWVNLTNSVKKILWSSNFTDDWKHILKNITQYTYINKKDIEKNWLYDKVARKISTKSFHQLRKSFANKKTDTNRVLYKNEKTWIAQGTPISWMLANIYMLGFDLVIRDYVERLWGRYYRYSDDILVIIPHKNELSSGCFRQDIKDEILKQIASEWIKLQIQSKKTEIFDFRDWKLCCSFHIKEWEENFCSDKIPKPVQYLWFTFDGEKILIRNKTLAKNNFRMIESLKKLSRLKKRVSRIKWMSREIMLGEVTKRFTHSGSEKKDKKYWNFYWYVKSADTIMNPLQEKIWQKGRIKKQMRKNPKNFQKAVEKHIKKNSQVHEK